MNAVAKFAENIYCLLSIITMAMGVIVAMMFGFSIIMGGSYGESLAVFAGSIMNWGIRIAAIATLFGILNIYLSRQHTLTMDMEAGKQKNIVTPERPA